jgi:hypothetical protein
MHSTSTSRRAALVLLGVVAALLLVWAADSALAAPRSGITYARGVPAEAQGAVPQPSEQPRLTGASIAAAPGSTTEYLVLPSPVAWAVGAAGAVVLLGVAGVSASAQRRGRGGRPAELAGGRPVPVGSGRSRRDAGEDRRKAA